MYFLIDYENVSYAGLEGTEFLNKQDNLSIFYSVHYKSIVSRNMKNILDSGCDFQICKLKNTRKNALDFYIASKVGEIFTLNPNAKVAIISKDKGYLSVIDYWKSRIKNNQLVCAKSIANGIELICGEETRKELVNEKMKILDLETEYAKYQERNRILRIIENLFFDTEYKKFTSQIVDIVMTNKNSKIIYLDSLKSFGKKAGTEVYRKIKKII